MISFCKKSVLSLFNNIIPSTTLTQENTDLHRNTPQSVGAGLGILTNHVDVPKPNNVIESSSLRITGLRKNIKEDVAVAPEIINSSKKKDHIDVRVRALGGRDTDGLASCTESLGFESCTERSMSNELFGAYGIDYYEKTRVKKKSKREKIDMSTKVFPPPLTTLNENGKPVFILKPERKDGRLQLTKVQIYRKESLRAYRQNGRLIMHLVDENSENEGAVDVGTTKDKLGDTKEKKVVEEDTEDKLGDSKGKKVVEEDTDDELGDSKEKKVVEEEWKFPENCSGGEDCRWLSEMVVSHDDHHHHHHNMHGWGQQCVTIR